MNQLWADVVGKIRDVLGIPAQLTRIDERLNEQTKTIGTANERNEQEHKIQDERLEYILAKYDQSKTNESAQDDPHYRVQNWIRWGTWAAFGAATVYAGITGLQWRDAHRDFMRANRPWVYLPDTIDDAKVSGSSSVNQVGSAVFTLRLRNAGKTPAIVWEPHFVFANLKKPEIRLWKYTLKYPDVCGHPGPRFKVPVFPDVPKNRPNTEGFGMESTEAIGDSPPKHLSGCIVYYGGDGSGPYRTKAVYNVSYSEGTKISKIELADIDVE